MVLKLGQDLAKCVMGQPSPSFFNCYGIAVEGERLLSDVLLSWARTQNVPRF